ncbi:hypothetical protein [Rhodoligotrophos ferricapiens]|uniref:hypothetical protein n=1 Tax=Rhodoligotrophos ferricapiens TaxID=3069264 RepID=UPI00315C9BFF
MLVRIGLALLFISIAGAAAAERHVECTFDRMSGFNAVEGKIERTRADTVTRWSLTEAGDGTTSSAGRADDQGGRTERLDTPETINWLEISETGGITITTIYKQVRRSPGRYLASQSRTAPLAVAGATPTLAVGSCKVDPPL